MTGSIIFRPLQITLNLEKDPLARYHLYCKFKMGHHTARTSVTQTDKDGTQAQWTDVICFQRNKNDSHAKLLVKHKKKIPFGRTIGEATIDLETVLENKKVTQWYNIVHKGAITGQVLLDIEYDILV